MPYDEEPEHPYRPDLENMLDGRYQNFCRSCGRWAEEYSIFNLRGLVILILSLAICITVSKWIGYPILFIAFVLYLRDVPYFRKPAIGKYPAPEERLLGTARFRWFSVKEGGIGLPRLRIYNYMIFPVCFVDRHDRPITHTGCVRLCKKYFFLFQGAKLRLITDAIDAKKVGEGMRFYIFNQGEIIGEGVVEKYLYRDEGGRVP